MLIIGDLNLLQGGTGSLARYTQGLEDGLLSAPLPSKRGLRVGCLPAITLLFLGEIPVDERIVLDIDGCNVLYIDANFVIGPSSTPNK